MITLNILKENCDPKKDNNSALPYNAYLVQYKVGDKEETRWDLAMAFKMSEIFDHCLLYTSPSPRDDPLSRMPSSA